MLKFCLSIVLAILAPAAFAGTAKATAPQWNYTSAKSATVGDVGSFASVLADRTYTPAADRGVTLQDLLRSPVQSAAIAEMSYGRVATAAAVDMAIGRAIAVATVGMASYEIASAVRCKVLGPGATGCDDGSDPETTTETEYTAGSNSFPAGKLGKGSTPASACSGAAGANAASQSGSWGSQSTSYTVVSSSPTACNLRRTTITCNSVGACDNPPINDPFNAGMIAAPKTETKCPASVDASNPANSIPAGAPVGVDGKCATGRYQPKTPEQVAAQVAKDPNVARRAPALKEAIDNGYDTPTLPGVLTGPESVSGQPTTRTETGPNGTTTTTTTPRTRFGYDGETVTATDDPIVVTEHPDGTVTTTEGAPPPQEIITCGLPDTPPCKIDETGTPTSGDFSAPGAAITAEKDKGVKAIEDAGKRTSLPWSWTWALPQGACSPIRLGSEAHPVMADPCNSPGVSLWRTLLAWYLAMLTALHIWRSVSELGG